MIVRTAWAQDGEPAAAMTWRYPAVAEHPFPSGAINAVLASFYNDPNQALDHPYLFIARDRHFDQIGLVITDPEGVPLDLEDINALYRLTIDETAERGWKVDPSWECRTWSNVPGDAAVIEWPFPFTFPVDVVNVLLAALYDTEADRPFIFPVFARVEEDDPLQQIGLLIGTIELAGEPSENWRIISDRYRVLFEDDITHPMDVPWGQKEWSLQ